MPQVNKAIGNTYDTITRPAAIAVAKDCLKQMGFDENAYLSFKGFSEAALNKTNSLEEIQKNFFGTDTTAEVEINESPRQGMLYTMSVFRPDNMTIFRDEKSNLYMRPVKQRCEIELTFKLRFAGKGAAMRWRDDVYARGNLMRHKNYHRITYSYPIPLPFMDFLYDMHKIISEEDVDEEKDFADWFFKYSDKRMTTLTNDAGRDHMVVLPESQVRVLGWYNFEEIVDKPQYDKDNNTWNVEWSYTFLYDKVIECVLSHELVVRQQPIPDRWFPVGRPYDLDLESDLASSNVDELAETQVQDFATGTGIYINRQPMVDTWWPLDATQLDLKYYKPAFIALTTLLPDDNQLVINLNEMGDFELKPALLAYIASDRNWVTKPRESIINVSIFGNNSVAMSNQQVLDEMLNLKATGNLNRAPVYRVVISVLQDLTKLTPGADDRAKDNACLLNEALKELWERAAKLGLIPRPNNRCQWTTDQWNYIKDLLSPPQPGRPWPWGWPPRVPGLDLDPGYKPGTDDPNWPSDLNLISAIRSVGMFQIVARRKSNASS